MKSGLLAHLACPACGSALALVGWPRWRRLVEAGRLRCEACASTYLILDGVPRCLVAGADATTIQTQRRYDFIWRRIGQRALAEAWEKDSLRYFPMIPKELFGGPGSLGLEAGCGAGRDLLNVAALGAEVIGVDLSAGGVVSAHDSTAHLPNAHVVQADIHRLPFRPKTFDFAYSFGVLHHLPDPARGFERLAGLLKPGAPLVTYLYEDFSDRSAAERAGLGVARGIRHITARLPNRLLLALCWLGVPVIWSIFSVPARLLRRPWPGLAGRLPFRHTLRWPVLASDLFDRFAPPVEWRYGPEDIERLYRNSGFTGITMQWYRGWVTWGFKG